MSETFKKRLQRSRSFEQELSKDIGTTPEFMGTLSSPKLSRALCDKNPRASLNLRIKLETIERNKRSREIDLFCDQREFFIKSVFDETHKPRFVKIPGNHIKDGLFAGRANKQEHHHFPSASNFGNQRSTTVAMGDHIDVLLRHKLAHRANAVTNIGLFLPPVNDEAPPRPKANGKSAQSSPNPEKCRSRRPVLESEFSTNGNRTRGLRKIVSHSNTDCSTSAHVSSRLLRKRSISMQNLTASLPDYKSADDEKKQERIREKLLISARNRRLSISLQDLSSAQFDLANSDMSSEISFDILEQKELEVDYDTCDECIIDNQDIKNKTSTAKSVSAPNSPRLLKSRVSSSLSSNRIQCAIAETGSYKLNKRDKQTQSSRRRHNIKSSITTSRPASFSGFNTAIDSQDALCDANVLRKLTSSLPTHLYQKAQENGMNVVKSDGILDIKETLIKRNRCIASKNVLSDPRWKRLEAILSSASK